MVYTTDLKSVGYCSHVGSNPTSGTKYGCIDTYGSCAGCKLVPKGNLSSILSTTTKLYSY